MRLNNNSWIDQKPLNWVVSKCLTRSPRIPARFLAWFRPRLFRQALPWRPPERQRFRSAAIRPRWADRLHPLCSGRRCAESRAGLLPFSHRICRRCRLYHKYSNMALTAAAVRAFFCASESSGLTVATAAARHSRTSFLPSLRSIIKDPFA